MKTRLYQRNMKGNAFRKFLLFMGDSFPRFSVATCIPFKEKDWWREAKHALILMEPFLISSKIASDTPLVRVLSINEVEGPLVELQTYRSSPEVFEIMVTSCNRLFRWDTCRFPGDLTFYREDDSIAFGCHSRRHFSSFEFTPEELEKLKKALPYIRWNFCTRLRKYQ